MARAKQSVRYGKIHAALAIVAVLVPAAACLDNSITGVRPLTFSLTATPTTTTVGEPITFNFTATGTALREINIDYQDGEATLRTYNAAVEITDFAVHAFDQPGTYMVAAEAIASSGVITDTVTVTIN